MVNHFRTLLANLAPMDIPFSEYIETTYTPRTPSAVAARVRKVLLGDDPCLIHYRTASLVRIIRASPLSSRLTSKDKRVIERTPSWSRMVKWRVPQQKGNGDPLRLWFDRSFTNREDKVRFAHNLVVDDKEIAGSSATFTVSVSDNGRDHRSVVVSGASVATEGIPLIVGTDALMAQIPLTAEVGQSWDTHIFIEPSSTLNQRLTAASSVDEVQALFYRKQGDSGLRSVWFDSPYTTHRLAALACALVEDIDE